MSNGLDLLAGKIAPLIQLLDSDVDGEVLNAARALKRVLASNGLDIHHLAERIENGRGGALIEAEMRKIWERAIQWYEANAAATRAATEPEPAAIFTSVRTVERPTESGVNGYSWQQIAEHCARNKHLFSGKSLEFVENLPEKLHYFGGPTLKQANWRRDLFMTRCGGRID